MFLFSWWLSVTVYTARVKTVIISNYVIFGLFLFLLMVESKCELCALLFSIAITLLNIYHFHSMSVPSQYLLAYFSCSPSPIARFQPASARTPTPIDIFHYHSAPIHSALGPGNYHHQHMTFTMFHLLLYKFWTANSICL